ncbi:hybrid signal transduction histidine kinase M [Tanacetum coccineum]
MRNFGVLKHIEGSSTQSSTSTPPTDDWITTDSIVKSWIFLTLSSTLRKRLIKANPKTATDAWDTIEAIFQDNKRTRVVVLKGELRMIQMGNQTADEYFSNIDSIVTLLNDLGSDLTWEPFPDLSTVRSMASTEEMRIQNESHSLSVSTNSSAPQVLYIHDSSRSAGDLIWQPSNNLLSWSSKRQFTLSRSSAEAEYRGVSNAVAETCWLRNLLRELHTPLSTATIIYCDNYADIFTKGLPTALFDEFRDRLSVRSSPAQTAGEC